MAHDIFVTNKNNFYHSDAHNGVIYEFPVNERVAVPVDAAMHMFGFQQVDKTDTLHRLGWATRLNKDTKQWEDDPNGPHKLARFVFTKAVLVEQPAEDAPAHTSTAKKANATTA